MSSPPPTKPPRGVKQGKETSGLLMSVIRTLSASETNELREKERAKLEKEYKKSDARLDELVGAHTTEIMEVMQKFTAVSAGLSAWDQHCDAAVARLAACRGLLQLKRDDLHKLWVDARTHHYALEMLTEIESVVVSPRAVSSEMSSGRSLSAAVGIQKARHSLQALSHVTALDHTRTHLENLRRTLVDKIVKDLSIAVYGAEPIQKDNSKRRINMLLAELMKPEEVTESCLQEITPEFEASLSDDDRTFETNVMISLEALGVLEQLKEATEMFKVQIQSELLEVIEKMSRRIIDEGDIDLDSELEQDSDIQQDEMVSETGRPLAKLIACLSEEFRACAARNRRLIQLWRAALQKFKIPDSCLHTEQHYWSAVQQVLQLLLSEYLEMESVTQEAARASSAADAAPLVPLNAYYTRKKQNKARGKLYKLTSVSTPFPLSVRFPLVCGQSPRHLYALLPPLTALGTHIEQALGGSECSLRAFVTDYVRTGEADRLAADARREVDRHMSDVNAWRHVDTDTSVPPGRPVLSCVLKSWAGISRAVQGAARCHWAGGVSIVRRALVALEAAAHHCNHHQNRLTPHSSVRAIKWLADDDIVRFLQSLPNWKAAISTDPVDEDKQNEEELQQAYEREAEILGSSLGDSSVFKKEIIVDVATLADIALMCESMNWFKTQIRSIPSLVGPSMKLPEDLLKEISAEALKFEDIEHKCLLLLHLEIRIQCFHYLCGEDADAGATRLAQALLSLHEMAAHVLQPRRMNYVVQGVGEMMSVGVVWAGRARLAALRHCLAALGLPLAGLQRAQLYLQLVANSPQEIIENIREKGPQFTELEYLNAFKIIGAKRGLSQSDMKGYLKQLSSALGHIGVTV